MNRLALILCVSIIALAASATSAQERKITPTQTAGGLQIRAPKGHFSCSRGTCVETYSGDVAVRLGEYFLQADKVIRYKREDRVVAEGNVVFIHRSIRKTGSRLEWNVQSGEIISFDTTGFNGRRVKSAVSTTRLEEAIKKAYDLPGEMMRRDVEALNRMQTESAPTQPPAKCPPR